MASVPRTLVGRQGELGLLETALRRAHGGGGGAAMLVGEAGIGKTRTALEVQALSAAAGFQVGCTTCYESEWLPPYEPWLVVLGELLGGREREFLQAQPEVRLAVLAELIPDLLHVLPELPPAPRLSPEEARYRATDSLARLILDLAEQPLLIVLDDLQWADAASLELIAYVGRLLARSRLLVVGTYRDAEVGLDHPLARCLAELDRQDACLRVPLGPLPHDEALALVEHLAGQPVAPALAETVLRETQGHPFFIEELVRHLLEECTDLSAPAPLGIPASVRQAIGARLARLAPETRQALAVASAFTRPFDFAVLREMTGLSEEELLTCLDEALRAHMLQSEGGERYEFAHALVRRTLYDELSPSRRTRLHRRIAQALERVHAGRELQYAPELADQYHASASLPGAAHGIRYALAAAEQAIAAHGHEQAIAFLRMASDLAVDSDVAICAEIACRLALAEAEAVLVEDAERSALEALSLLEEASAELARIAAYAAAAGRRLQDAGSSDVVVLPLAERGLAALGERHDLTWARLRLLERPVERIEVGPVNAGRWLGFDAEAVAIARASSDEEDYARTLEVMDPRTPGELDELLDHIERWQDPAAKIHGLTVVVRTLVLQHGALRRAVDVASRLLSYGGQVGSLPGQAYAVAYLATAQAALGEFREAERSAERAKELMARLGPGHRLRASKGRTGPHGVLTLDHEVDRWRRTDWEAAGRLYYDMAVDIRHPAWMGVLHAAQAAEAFARGADETQARMLVSWILSAILRSEPTRLNQNGAVGSAAAAVWELEAAEHAAGLREAAVALIAAGVGDYPGSSTELSAARMASLLGDADGAAGHFERARSALDVSGQRPLRAVVDYDEARHRLRSRLPGAAPLLAAARSRFEELRMAEWVERADRLASRLGEGYPDGLTGREVEVLRLLAAGSTNAEIAASLVISVHTVERHLANVYRKIGARNRAEAAAYTVGARL